MDDRRGGGCASMDVSASCTPQRPPGADGFRLIETMRWHEGRVHHRVRHADRLARSARCFGVPFSEEAFYAAVQQATTAIPGVCNSDPHRIRLTLGPSGGFRAEAAPLEAEGGRPLRLALAEKRARFADLFFRHKTTWRHVYQRAFQAARQRGLDEALLLNERREVTEGTRANLFVEQGGTLYTPPVRCGLLPGVGRAVLLEEAHAEERVLQPADLRTADALWLVSALRGRRRAVLAEGADEGEQM